MMGILLGLVLFFISWYCWESSKERFEEERNGMVWFFLVVSAWNFTSGVYYIFFY